ncbi:helix-turn-helix domain-containing protein [Pseudoalteromonas sp. PAR1]|uniref:helix-turn-helix transcriptional regulator n=1 Tax=Pseudoalteromonas sp. PAR1 TaxID=2853443 RepID=UPI00248C6FFE|nr:helix-turn-helix domain-containing protein [Pseudoalteromonas sp. PAR1]
MEQKPLLTPDDLAMLLGISRTSLWRLQQDEKLPEAIRLGPRMVRWRRESVEKWLLDYEQM